MIDSAIYLITSQLNQYLRRTFNLTEDIVAVSNILEQDGTVPPHVDNKLVAFLVNIEKDQFPHRGPSNGNTVGAGLSLSYLFQFPRPPHYNVVVVDKMSFSIQKDLLTERGKLYLDILPNDPMEMKQALIDFKNAERI